MIIFIIILLCIVAVLPGNREPDYDEFCELECWSKQYQLHDEH